MDFMYLYVPSGRPVLKQLLFRCCDDNKIKMARKPGKKQKQNPVGCTGEGKRWKRNNRRVQRR